MKQQTFQARIFYLFIVTIICFISWAFVKNPPETPQKTQTILHEKPSHVPEKIEVKPTIDDEEISNRLENILKTTNWFSDPTANVQNGVVFLAGSTKNHQFKKWASELAHNTQDVAAVVNKIVVLEPSVWDLHMILSELLQQLRKMIRALPGIIFGSIILFISWIIARFTYKIIPLIFRNKLHPYPSLLNEVIARGISSLVFLLGVYFIFEMAELTTMALTVISGTGLIGLILGIAFRDITENFLSSILLSIQTPFQSGDLIDIISPAGVVTGHVDRLTLRVTILISLDGNHLQIPNSTVYKSNIRNYSTNPNHREDFVIGIGINCSISKAEEIALKLISEHEAILQDPEPFVLVDSLAKDSVNLRVYYWIDNRKYNFLKVKSSVLRLIKQEFQAEEIGFPMAAASNALKKIVSKEKLRTTSETESKLDSQKKKNKGISADSHLPEKGENLLEGNKIS
jgi:small conductance mechanosensitive channel